jgi:poly(hydroxyalkanoate) depolymerase family esterase
MNPEFQKLMRQATQLTQSGNLQAATAMIQAALGGRQPQAELPQLAANDSAPAPATGHDDVIDVVAREAGQAGGAARFIAGTFATTSGKRDYKLFIPAGAGETPMPLVVMLHGCTQTPDDFAAGTAMNDVAQAQGCYVLYPAQSQQANPQRCWNWFKHSHQQRGRGEPALIAGMTKQVMAAHAIDADRVYVAGLSAGGAMAAILGDTYPELFAAIGVHSGLAAGAASDLPSAMAAMQGNGKGSRMPLASARRPTIVFHGDADSTVHPRNGEEVAAASSDSAIAPDVHQQQPAGKRRSTRRVHRDGRGKVLAEHWVVHGAPHAWAGGNARGSYTDARGPDASTEMLRFFLEHPRGRVTA